MTDIPFWQQKTLEQMSDAEWESLCDGCGQCCLNKLQDEDTDAIYFTNVACNQLNIKTCQCRNYARRFELEADCLKLTRENLPTFSWLPPTCAYRLIADGQDLPLWHPLRSGSKAAMHAARISVRHIAVRESEVQDWEDHILNPPGQTRRG
ncbi:YcgN family cysteine cluster protein [Pantoea sp. 1.19]|uniref:YcgN family cysteine cluster protein n=1 Tax=Pantoea sp. 1.19 TaxID=1925589 RepID=UPI00094897A3|nr:YcgN family cysteine cluster protein [Pantoea sp. 1.19]